MRAMMGLVLLALLGGCAIGGNQYYTHIEGSSDVRPSITNTPNKKVDTTVGAAVSATAAASQSGDAKNGGSSQAEAAGGKQ